MKGALIIAIVFTFPPLISGQPGSGQFPYMNYLDHPWVDSVLATLSREERNAQSTWVVTRPGDGLREFMEISRVIREYGLGGLIFTASPDQQMQELARSCGSFSKLPLAIALEGRWSGQYPDRTSLAAIASDSLRYLAGSRLADGLRKQGVQLILAKGVEGAIASCLFRSPTPGHCSGKQPWPGWLHHQD